MKRKAEIHPKYVIYFLAYLGVVLVSYFGTRDLGDWKIFFGMISLVTILNVIIFIKTIRIDFYDDFLVVKGKFKKVRIDYKGIKSITIITNLRFDDSITFSYNDNSGSDKIIKGILLFLTTAEIKKIFDSVSHYQHIKALIGKDIRHVNKYSINK